MRHRFSQYFPYVLLVLFSIAIFAPLLFAEMVFYGEEQIGFYYAISYYVHDAIQNGKPLLWISNYYGGTSASLDQFVSAWYPLNRLLFSLFDTFAAHHISITIATAMGLIGSYLFGRSQGWLATSSISLALMYFLGTTYSWLQIGTTAAHSFAILPFLLLALHIAAVRKKYLHAILLGGVALGIGFLAGFMQIVFYAYVIAGAYALFLDWNAYTPNLSFLRNIKISYTYAAITIIGLGCGFMQFFPSASLIDNTIRTSSYASQHATFPYPTEFIALFLPPYLSIPFFSGGASSGFYISVLGLIFAILGLFYFRTRSSIFFATIYVLIAAFAFHLPPFGWINEHLPPFSRMGGNFRWMVAAAFPLAFLGAVGIEGYLRNPEAIPKRLSKWIMHASIATCATLVIGSIGLAAFSHTVTSSPAHLESLLQWYTNGRTLSFPHEHYIQILTSTINNVATLYSLTNPRFLFGTLLWALAALIFALPTFRLRTHASNFILTFVLITALGTTILQWNELIPRTLYSEPELARVIRSQGEARHEYRVMGFLIGDGTFLKLTSSQKLTPKEITSVQMQTLVNNTNIYSNFDRMDGMAPYRTLRHNHLLDTVIAYGSATYVFDDLSPKVMTSALDQLYNYDVQKKVSLEEKIQDLPKRLALLSMMNVKYIYSSFELTDPTLIPIALIPIATEKSGYIMHVYKNTAVMPRIYVAHEATFVSSERDAFRATIAEKDFSQHTWIECATCKKTKGNANISISHYEPGDIEAIVTATDDVWLVVSESAFPGWHATIDGIETPLHTANYLFQAILVPKGEHRVTFSYRDIALDEISLLLFNHESGIGQ